jgi:hypothetical protein
MARLSHSSSFDYPTNQYSVESTDYEPPSYTRTYVISYGSSSRKVRQVKIPSSANEQLHRRCPRIKNLIIKNLGASMLARFRNKSQGVI